MSNTPTPPAGYKLVKGEDIKDCVPEGSKLWLYGSMSWRPSVDIGEKANPALYDDFYAIPETKPEHPNKAAKVAKLEDIPDDAYIFSQWITHFNDWMSFRPTKKSAATDPYSACWFAYTDASDVHPDHDTAPYDIKTSVMEKPEPVANNPLSQQEGGDHYKSLAIQPVEFIQANKLSFLEGCVVKRVCRHRAKNKAEDIRKAIHELRLILKLEYGEDLP